VQRPGQSKRQFGTIGRCQTPGQRCPQVIVLGFQPLQLGQLFPAAQLWRRRLGDGQEVLRVKATREF
jgi:hypothetical protein